MGTLDFKGALHFEEFTPVSTKEWEAVIKSDLKGKNYKEILRWESGEGLQPLPFYRSEDLSDLAHKPDPVRGSRNWSIVEPIKDQDIKSANKKALHALENGASGLFLSSPENVIHSKADLQNLLNNIQIELISLRFGGALSTPQISTWMHEVCTERNLKENDLDIAFTFDPFSQAIQSGKLAKKDSLTEIIKTFNSSFRFCTIDASVYGNAGATIIQQLAFALGAGNEYLGMNAQLGQNLHFNFASGPNYFLEIAKFRAFKLVLSQVLDEYGLGEIQPCISAETCLWNKSKTDAHNNMLRTTSEAMSAAIGGCNSIVVHPYNEHFEENSSFSSRIARNIQLILQEEAYLDKVTDPGAGSYYIEKLTDTIAEKSWQLFQEIEEKDGFHECLKNGSIQELISTSQQEKIEAFKKKKKVLVGVNEYQPEDKAQGIRYKAQEFLTDIFDPKDLFEIGKIVPLNIEAELQEQDV